MLGQLSIRTKGQGLHEITAEVQEIVTRADISSGLCTVFIQHTSASLTIQENADPTARQDLEGWLNRLVKENDPHFRHTAEGPDDMPSHIKSVLTQVSIGIPVIGNELALGTWQGIYLWEHRRASHTRQILVNVA